MPQIPSSFEQELLEYLQISVRQHYDELGESRHITNIIVYGSYLHGGFGPDSDLDIVLVGDFRPKQLKFVSPIWPRPANFGLATYEYKHRFEVLVAEFAGRPVQIQKFTPENFEKMLATGNIMFIECALGNALLSEIDFAEIYWRKYHNIQRLQIGINIEMNYIENFHNGYISESTVGYPDAEWQSYTKYMIKKICHVVRYIYEFLTLVSCRRIYFGRCTDYRQVNLDTLDVYLSMAMFRWIIRRYMSRWIIPSLDLYRLIA